MLSILRASFKYRAILPCSRLLLTRTMANAPFPNDFTLYAPLKEIDPEVDDLIHKETWRQFSGLELIASENLTSRAAMEANGSILTNKYSEGLPGARYYGGNEHIDVLERLCQKRALEAFHLDPSIWGVNVQPYSGSTANFAAFTALIEPQDRIMGLGLPDGGHLTHGYYTAKKKISASSIYFQSFPYSLDPTTQLIDYPGLRKLAHSFKPRLIVCGASAYPRDWDYKKLREAADEHNAYLLADIAHTSGLIASQELNNPFEYCDVVTTTTQVLKSTHSVTLFLHRKGSEDLENRVNMAVFPACQGGPHNNTIAAVAVSLRLAAQPEFKVYAKQVIQNARVLAEELLKHNYTLQTGGTDSHLILWDLRPLKLTGSKVEKIGDLVGITINKNAVSGDASAQVPGGIRLGTSALTSRSMNEEDIKIVADFLHRSVQLALVLQREAGSKLLKDFVRVATSGDGEGFKGVQQLRRDVRAFARKFPLPGVDITTLTKPAGLEEDD
ncbi:hydroxymethyltransferase [Cantharellus anzutake]|uniref:hydroxymethyltransferase n=1 Tax=Cantharellus anzutake TaxID=1750568 RepID=UPI001907BECF|nr:hydroxymethyltransferase [Cantharellus anzutake]KAF8324261.1 hydroxymethyltransferase [Cantharellus anzutake]